MTRSRAVRPADTSDIDALTAIWFDGWHDAHAALVPGALAQLRTRENFRERLLSGLGSVRVLGATGTPLGFVMLRGDELYQFYVAAVARGTGVAAALMADAEAQLLAQGVRIAWLACAVGNTRAARFYEKCGWRRSGTVILPSDTSERPFPLEVWRYEKDLRRGRLDA
jgi:GNAT superfamily N-acetyltransferase